MTILEHALKYASIGWHVFPCNPSADPAISKKPLPFFEDGKCGDNFSRATTDPEIIKKMWEKYPDALIGIGCGNSNLCVVDLDRKNGKDGIAVFDAIKHEDVVTVEQRTQSGGIQLIFKATQQIAQGTDTNGFEGIDTRNHGGYFICAPSKLKNGNIYEWISDQSPFDMAPADLPNWIYELFKETKKTKKFTLPDKTLVGNRDDTLFRYACSLKSRNDLDYQQVFSAVKSYNKDFCKPPIEEDVLVEKINQAFKYDDSCDENDPLNDIYNSSIFINKNKELARFCDRLGGWFVYNSQIWKQDDNNKILGLAHRTYKEMNNQPPEGTKSPEDKKRWRNHIKSTGNERNLKSMINLSKRELSCDQTIFDKDNNLICLKNGIFDLLNYKFLPFNHKYYITKQANVIYNPDAECPEWLRFLNVIFETDKDVITYVQKLCGYCLTADVSHQVFPIFYGGGSNGKSTLCLTLNEMLGDYAKSTSADTFMASKSERIRNDIAALKGARFVIASETERSKILDTSAIKNFTSDEPINARFLHKEFFQFIPTFKVFLLTNPLPKVDATDDGTWRRLRLIPFNHKFNEADKIIDYHSMHLYPEIPGIFNWCLAGLKALNEDGELVPDRIKLETQEYRDAENIIGNFIEEYCKRVIGWEVLSPEMWKFYVECMREEGTMNKGKHAFFNFMRMNGFKREQCSSGSNKGSMCFYGLKPIAREGKVQYGSPKVSGEWE